MKCNFKMCIEMSYIETYKTHAIDLLSHNTDKLDSQTLRHVTVVKMKDEYSAMKTLFKAEGRRQFSEDYTIKHVANGVLTLHITLTPHNQTEPIKKIAKIHIVDLAGVDTFGNLTSLHKDITQIENANLTRSQLEQFILILCQNIPQNIIAKQRLNILIHYLGDALSTHNILRFIGHLRTNKENLLISLSMLRFGQIVRGLKPQKLHYNVTENKDAKLEMLKQELLEIKKMQDLDKMLANSDLSRNITQERIKHMQHVAEEYLQNKTNEIVVLNVTDANTVLKIFKDLYNKLEAEKAECTRQAYEKAYEDVLMNLKKSSSKVDNGQSIKNGRKGSRKSLKSHESFALDEKSIISKTNAKKQAKESTSRASTPSITKLAQIGKRKSQEKQQQQLLPKSQRQSRTSGSIIKKSSASRHRSSSSTATGGTGANESIVEEMVLPDKIPVHNEAWNLFVTDSVYNYKELANMVGKHEQISKEIQRDYVYEVKTLQKLIDAVEIRKSDYQKAQMQRLFKKEVKDKDGNVVIGDLESLCLENLKTAHNDLVKQQEKVLKFQTELRIALEGVQNTKKTIVEQYELFCQQKFQTPLPDLEEVSMQAIADSTAIAAFDKDDEEDSAEICLMENNHDVIQYENLKLIMKRQITKNIYKRGKSKKWVQSCKT